MKIWLKCLNLFLKMTILSLIQMWNFRNSSHHMRVYIWTRWRISCSKMNKFSLGFGSGTLMIFFSFGQPVKKNLMCFWNDSAIAIPNLKFTHEPFREEINFLDELIMVNWSPVTTANLLMAISTFTLSHVNLVTENLQLFLVKLWEWEEFVLRKVIALLMLETWRTGSRKEAIQRTWLTSKQKRYLKVLH